MELSKVRGACYVIWLFSFSICSLTSLIAPWMTSRLTQTVAGLSSLSTMESAVSTVGQLFTRRVAGFWRLQNLLTFRVLWEWKIPATGGWCSARITIQYVHGILFGASHGQEDLALSAASFIFALCYWSLLFFVPPFPLAVEPASLWPSSFIWNLRASHKT